MDDDFKAKLKKELEDILKNGFNSGMNNEFKKALKSELEDILKTEFKDSRDNSQDDVTNRSKTPDNVPKGFENEADGIGSKTSNNAISKSGSEKSGTPKSDSGKSEKALFDSAIFEALAAKVHASKVDGSKFNNSKSGQELLHGADKNSESAAEKTVNKTAEKAVEAKNEKDNGSQKDQNSKTSSKKEKPETSESAERPIPKHLNWKVLDDFDKVPDNKMFYVNGEGFTMTYSQRERVRPLFKQIRDKYKPKLEELFESFQKPPKTHLEIAGGNYTFYFILPHVMNLVKEAFPHLQIKLTLFEDKEGSKLSSQNADIILRGDLVGNEEQNAKVLLKAREAGYIADDKFFDDAMFFAASKELVEEFGGIEQTLAKANVIVGREYSSSSSESRTNLLYSEIPEIRKHQEPRVIVDQYYMKYLFMKNAVGIGHIHRSMPDNGDDWVILDHKPLAEYKRYCLVKKDLNKRYVDVITKIIIDVLNNGKIK